MDKRTPLAFLLACALAMLAPTLATAPAQASTATMVSSLGSPALATAAAARHLAPAPRPTITGTATVGKTLTARPGTWGPKPVTLKYQWRAAGKAIAKATGATYKLTAAQTGKRITVTVTASKPGYTTAHRTSTATRAVAKPAPKPGCNPRTPSGRCYKAGQFCPAAWHGRSGTDADGRRIACRYSGSAWRWVHP